MAAPQDNCADIRASEPPPWVWPRAAYIHVPFCAHHCGYCDFAVVAGRDHLSDHYLTALEKELSMLGGPQPVDTVFIGGGTPTHLGLADLERLLEMVSRCFRPRQRALEFTVEANPDSLDAAKVDLLAAHLVTRVSLGAQSFHAHHLRSLERNHKPCHVAECVALLRGRIHQVSLDLMFGTPGESLADWAEDLRQALALEPDHLSTYGLTYEKGTRLWKQQRLGAIQALGEDEELAMYRYALDVLGAAGFESYEVSSHARPGCRCRHNETYWANEAYFGVGLGAARYINGRRETNTRSLDSYLRLTLAGESAVSKAETLSPRERAQETLALQLRRTEGVNRRHFLLQTGFELDALARPAINRHLAMGFLVEDTVGIRLSREGLFVADTVVEAFL